MREYVDEMYCPNCDKYTQQQCVDSEHERDASGDRQECTVCKWYYSGYTAKWYPPFE